MLERLKQWLKRKLGSSTGVYYIGGSDILPPPLNQEEEKICLQKLQMEGKEGKKARDTLIEHNLRLVVYISKKFENTGVLTEDLISIGAIGLMKAINTFNPEKISNWPPMHQDALKTRSLCISAAIRRSGQRSPSMNL